MRQAMTLTGQALRGLGVVIHLLTCEPLGTSHILPLLRLVDFLSHRHIPEILRRALDRRAWGLTMRVRRGVDALTPIVGGSLRI